MAGLVVAPDVNDELDVPAALPPQPLTGRHSAKNRGELVMKLCWSAGRRETFVRRGESRNFQITLPENCDVSFT